MEYKNRFEKVEIKHRNIERREALEEIIEPIQDWINKYGTPHDVLIIQQGNAQLYSGELSIQLKILD